MSKILILGIIIAVFIFFIMRQSGNKEAAMLNVKLGLEFLATNKSEEGVIETASGLQYKVLTQGDGTEYPSASSKVKVHYHGTLLDGSVFDSSVDKGQQTKLSKRSSVNKAQQTQLSKQSSGNKAQETKLSRQSSVKQSSVNKAQ